MECCAGHRLRALREQLGLTIREVEAASQRIAERHHKEDFAVPLSRLSEIETKGILPSIYRLYSLAAIYRRDLRELLAWYGVNVNDMVADLPLARPANSHLVEALDPITGVRMPVRLDPGFDLRRTTNLGRMVERWGVVPLAFLEQLAETEYTYGYIGSEDFTMYPLLAPCSLVQVDEKKSQVIAGVWRSELERPIYFVETREGFRCCWCAIRGDQIILQPHPLSLVPVNMVRYPQEAEVLGQVVGVAMRLGDWDAAEPGPTTLPELN